MADVGCGGEVRGGAERALIDFLGEVKDEYRTTVSNVRDKVELKLTGATAAELARRPIEYDTGMTLLPGQYKLKLLARDAETGRMGTYERAFVVPNLAKETRRIPISSVVLSSQRVDMREAIFNASKDKTQVVNPMVWDGKKIIPSVTRVFRITKDLFVYFQAYQGGETVEPVAAYVTLFRNGEKALETAPVVVAEGGTNRLKTLPVRFEIPLGKLSPGEYVCQVTLLETKGAKAAFWQAPLVLVP
ncbi:MAG: hypothetical protein NTV52_22000 [Acidobacteria bacterium]|nr:hypothetical protein [Acidobacteriota bacterium]